MKKLFDLEVSGSSYTASHTYIKGDIPIHNSLRNVLHLNDEELSQCGQFLLDFLDNPSSEFKDKYSDLSWRVQAWFEFQDILESSLGLQNEQAILNRHYCYLEATNILIDSLMAGIGGYFNASISSLRSFIELAVLEIYFKEISIVDGDYRKFRKWFSYESGPTPFKNTVEFIFPEEDNRGFEIVKERIYGAYKGTSTYVHKPRLDSSFTMMRKSNTLAPSMESIFYWVSCSSLVLQAIEWLYVISYPMCLFPVDIVKKFGYNWPMGVFFDNSNSKVLERALGNDDYAAFKKDLENHPDVKAKLEFYNNAPSKSKEEIEKSWYESRDDRDKHHSKEERITISKAELRAISGALTYKAPTKDFSEISPDESMLKYSKSKRV